MFTVLLVAVLIMGFGLGWTASNDWREYKNKKGE
jgi:hypothetical protein